MEWWYQKNAAEEAVRYLMGVRGVNNLISLQTKASYAGVEKAINTAFERNALLDAKKISLEINGGNVVLKGKVRN